MLGLVLLFVPGIDVLTMDEYVESVSWNILLLIGCVQSLASGMQQQGAAKWLLDATIGKLGIGAGALTLSSAFLVPVIRWFLPVGPALIAITLPPLCLLGMDVGRHAGVLRRHLRHQRQHVAHETVWTAYR